MVYFFRRDLIKVCFYSRSLSFTEMLLFERMYFIFMKFNRAINYYELLRIIEIKQHEVNALLERLQFVSFGLLQLTRFKCVIKNIKKNNVIRMTFLGCLHLLN